MNSLKQTYAPAAGSSARPGYGETLRTLAVAQKAAAPGAPAYSVYINRKLGRFLAAGAYLLGLTPNMVTAISASFTFAAILAIAIVPPTLFLGIAVALSLAVGYAFDSADGQVARLRGGGGPAGEWLDHVVDCIKISSLHLAVLISAYRFFSLPSDLLLLVPIGYAIVGAVSFFAMILNDQLKAVYSGSKKSKYPSGGSTLLRSLLVVPTDYGLLCLVFVLLGAPQVFFAAYALLFVANLGYTALALPKWFRDMTRIDHRGAARS
ncbi:MAG: putative glycosyl transferase [Naasia sp.]|jgi:phosphatidylglycerophosphate synthase|uniref:CDP-alcohol phosphatidyltransferase family protein n=1 Tax=Naasia sp. TaxID=2546198 RepID=UPI00260C5321|nr:CDP-alcohol phosphatidyltransferase family protein [Naasia sp.]MCU1569988.1 putative glycosyl transferase [Naasia sp.]